jgi:hypothetical protein
MNKVPIRYAWPTVYMLFHLSLDSESLTAGNAKRDISSIVIILAIKKWKVVLKENKKGIFVKIVLMDFIIHKINV